LDGQRYPVLEFDCQTKLRQELDGQNELFPLKKFILTFENTIINVTTSSTLNIFFELNTNITNSTFFKMKKSTFEILDIFISSSFPKLVTEGYCGKRK
jgi:hypothetical protein